jgi:peptide/nickel transport system permease protein
MSDAVVPHKSGSTAPRMRFSPRRLFGRAVESDLFYSFRRSRITMIAAAVTALFFLLAIFAPLFVV